MGRKPVIEALHDDSLTFDKILLSEKARGPEIDTINGMAASRRISIEEVAEVKVTAVARSARHHQGCLLYTSPSPRDQRGSRMPSSA